MPPSPIGRRRSLVIFVPPRVAPLWRSFGFAGGCAYLASAVTATANTIPRANAELIKTITCRRFEGPGNCVWLDGIFCNCPSIGCPFAASRESNDFRR